MFDIMNTAKFVQIINSHPTLHRPTSLHCRHYILSLLNIDCIALKYLTFHLNTSTKIPVSISIFVKRTRWECDVFRLIICRIIE